MSVKISALALENVKRVKAFALAPSADGLTIIGGNNANGKTSVLDALAWALGGKKFEPTSAKREGAMNPPKLSVTLSNGLVVERKGKNSDLLVVDPAGKKHGQQLLDSFVSQFALDLPKFMNANDKEKAQILLQILGIGQELRQLDEQEQGVYNRRHAIGQLKLSKQKHAEELPEFPDTPDEPVSVMDLIQQQQAILAKNGENQRLREKKASLESLCNSLDKEVQDLKSRLAEREHALAQALNEFGEASKTTQQLTDESTAAIEASLADIESINARVAANMAKSRAQDEAAEYEAQYNALSAELDSVRASRLALLNGAALPLPGLGVTEGVLTYNAKAWDCMSGAEQLQVAVAIVRRLNPECGFVLIDKLEQFDLTTLATFSQWLTEQGLQAIATRVSTGEECSIVIEDGLPVGQSYLETVAPLPASDETKKEAIAWD